MTDPLDSQHDRPALVQERLALVGKVMVVLSLLACLAQWSALPPGEVRLSFWLLVATCVPWLILYADCRGSQRSATHLRVVEAGSLLLWVPCIAIATRLTVLDIAHLYLDAAIGNDAAQLLLLGLLEKVYALSLELVMSIGLVLRAAVVPTSPKYSGVLTAIAGLLYVSIWAISSSVFGSPIPRPNTTANLVLAIVSWWVLATIVCYVVSRVVFGLRAEVRDAKKLGQYTLLSKIGEGGMGVVYRARHAMMQRPTAIKLLSTNGSSSETLARFEREVQLTARLTHPNTITIFDYGRTPDGVFYYVMELLDGASLQAVIDSDGPQPAERVVSILLQLAGALEEAHTVGLIHRDIKPGNIILCTQGGQPDVAKLLDFGLVKDLKRSGVSDATVDGTISGTPHYMSPEQIARPESADARSDLYAVGALGYFALTGHQVFERQTLVELLAAHLHKQPVPPSSRTELPVPASLDAVLLSCLEKDPADRPNSAAELAERLRACDVGDWSTDRARAWWQQHGRNFQRADTAESSPKTIGVDIDRIRQREETPFV